LFDRRVRKTSVLPENRHPGHSTAYGGAVDYRLGKLERLGLIEGSWLDCGCAEGDYAAGLAHRGASSVVGIDMGPDSIASAQVRWANIPGLSFRVAAAEDLPFADETFERILLNEVLEHVEYEEQTLRELRRVLVGGGIIALFSPNRCFPFEGHGLVGPVRMSFPVPLVPWLPQRVIRRWLQARNYWPSELRDLVTANGFSVMCIDFALPLFEEFKWLPSPLLRLYRSNLDFFDRHRALKRFGVSTLVIARKS
jgi:ubiquinone/menaquinone biosynthesis C-methylase UbiE